MKRLFLFAMVTLLSVLTMNAQQYYGRVQDSDGYTNIRKGPGTKYAIVGKVRDGGYILYSGKYGDSWYKVYTQAGTFRGYMSAKKIQPTESPSF